jgi:hypothetical protein
MQPLRADLKQEISRWLFDQAGRENGLSVACLWAAMKTFREEIRSRVEALVSQNPDANNRPVGHPLLKYLDEHIIPEVRSRIDNIKGGVEWISPLLNYEAVLTDRNATVPTRTEIRKRWAAYVATAFTPINDTDLPIPVLHLPNPRFTPAPEEMRL